jgi:ribosomal protein S18 acetylase RimI-like enzyme
MAGLMPLTITPLSTEADAEICARLMAQSEPWLTLRRSYDAALTIIRDPTREVYVARDEDGVAGFLILCLIGAFVGYIQTVAVHPDRRGQGLGTQLIAFAERRIFGEFPNTFMCVSSFNHEARRLYERLGYQVIGELTDYILPGYSEILLRKTTGPLSSPPATA